MPLGVPLKFGTAVIVNNLITGAVVDVVIDMLLLGYWWATYLYMHDDTSISEQQANEISVF